MLFFYITISCFLADSKIKLIRRANEISFIGNSKKVTKSNEDSWYFVKFHFSSTNKNQIVLYLQQQGIQLATSNMISKNLFNLYLTPSQFHYITSNNYGEVHEIESDNKLANKPSKKWSFLTIETTNPQELIQNYKKLNSKGKCQFSFQYSTQTTFSIKGSKSCLTSLIPVLVQDKKIYAITYDTEAEELNCRGTGFTQKNTDKAITSIDENDGSHIVEIDRFLNKQGLDGTGINVLVVDTFLDTNSTFFYDPSHPIVELNQPVRGHRKIDYISVLETAAMSSNDHGTHTAGSIAGRALNDTSSSSKYNGCAPNSRLSFYSSTYRDFIPDEINKLADQVRPQISTNSWGRPYEGPLHDTIWDQIAHDRNDTLYVFSAGNSAVTGEYDFTDGYQSLVSPGSAKNILTVGATQSVSVDESEIGADKREIYMTDDEDETTHLTKILEWSVSDPDSNAGLRALFDAGRIKAEISRAPYQMKNNTVLVIDSVEQFNALSKEDPPYFVISTLEFDVPNFKDLGFKRTFPVLYLSNESIPKYESNNLETNYRVSKGYKRADFSSKGLGNLGLMKPDIMCPGVSIVSARAVVGGSPDHKGLTIKHGTSMATPICAGAAALIYQYFKEGRYRNVPMSISSSLARSFIITCSDPLQEAVYPNTEEGFGQVNLGKYIGNGFDTDNRRLLVGDRLRITVDGSRHLMSTFSVSNDEKIELKVTLSYLDLVLSPDSSAALAVDLDLVVVSPSGVVYRGNQREDDTEERYSTNERVIVRPDQVEKGDYEVHVFSSVPSSLPGDQADSVEFAITVFGSLDNQKNGDSIRFEKATKCIPTAGLAFSECNEETLENDCSFGFYGRSCQVRAVGFSADSTRQILKINPYGLAYVTFYYIPEAIESISYSITPVSSFEPKITVFYNNTKKGGPEINADLITVRNGYSSKYLYDQSNLPSEEIYALALIYNTAPYPTEFVLTGGFTFLPEKSQGPTEFGPHSETVASPEPEPESSKNRPTESGASNESDAAYWKKIGIVSMTFAFVFAALVIILVVLLFVLLSRNKRANETSESLAGIHNPLLT